MNTVRNIQMRWFYAYGPPTGRDTRRPIAIALVFACVATFAGSFVIGRSTVSSSPSQPAATPSVPISYAGTAVPIRLDKAPAIETLAITRTAVPRRARHHGGTRAVAPATTTRAAQTQAPSTPAPLPTPVSRPSPPATRPAPTTPAHHSAPHKGGGVSFDSSG